MLARKLYLTAVTCTAVVALALALSYLITIVLLNSPEEFTPHTTVLITYLVGVPVSFVLISQRLDASKVRDELTAIVQEKDKAAAENIHRREEARLAQARAEDALQQLRDSEQRYRLLADSASDIILRLDAEGGVEFASPSIRQLGFEPESLTGRAIQTLVHPNDFKRVESIFVASLSDPSFTGGQLIETRLRHADGQWIWMESRPSPIRGPDGATIAFTAALRNISDRKAIERNLAAVDAKFRMMAESASDVISRCDVNGVLTYVSPSARQLYGYDPEELIGQPAFSIFHPDDIKSTGDNLRALIRSGATGQQARTEYRTITKSGAIKWVEAAPFLITDPETGRVVEFQDIARDITDRKLLAAELADSERRYRILAEQSPDVIIRYDVRGVIEYISAAARNYGVEPGDVVGRNVAEFLEASELDRNNNFLRDLVAGSPLPQGEQNIWRARGKDGRVIELEGANSTVLNDDGQIVGVISVLRDVTARRAMEEELRAKREEAEAAARAKSQFLANMSHEIRTPLTGVIGFAGLLEQMPDLSEEAQRFASRISTSAAALLLVVNDVLDFSRLEANQIDLDPTAFDPRTFVESTADLVRHQATAKGLNLVVDLEESLGGTLIADSARIRQVMLNLLTNAVKFTDQGDVTLRAGWDPESQLFNVSVQDTGIGIPEELSGRLFQRFSQIDGSNTRRYGGTGLGLAICKGLVEHMGGEIGLESQPGVGSTFSFRIPAVAQTETGAPSADQATPVDIEPMRILVVDDVAINRELVRAMLSAFEVEVFEASCGADAVQAASTMSFDVILMDLQMPGMDGIAATAAIRALAQANRSTPILALSANALPAQVEACLMAGMDDHIAKPIDPRTLLTKIAQWASADGQPRSDTDPAGEIPSVNSRG